MSVSTRNRTASLMAIIGGILIMIAGGTGMVSFLAELSNIIQNLFGGKNETVETIFWVLIIISALGGLAVIIGGLFIYKEYVIIGKIFVMLGAGMGVIGLILALISALYQGVQNQFFSWLTTSFMGVGLILAIVAQYVAKRPGLISNKSKRK